MGKKIALFTIFLSMALAIENVGPVEFGRITYLNGEMRISRNSDNYAPLESSRVYMNDHLILGDNSAVRIKTNFNSILSLKNKTDCEILSPFKFKLPFGSAYVKNLSPTQYFIQTAEVPQEVFSSEFVFENNTLTEITPQNKILYNWGPLTDSSELYDLTAQPIPLNESLWRTAVFPGWGHLHIDNPYKGWPMIIFSTYLLYNALSINPAKWSSGDMQEIMNNKKVQFQQLYFVYWSWAILDIISETDNYNKKIMAEKTL